jgi:hypothetical protein
MGRRKSPVLKLNGMDDTEKQETTAKVTARLAARYPDAPRPLIAGLLAEEYELLDAGRFGDGSGEPRLATRRTADR